MTKVIRKSVIETSESNGKKEKGNKETDSQDKDKNKIQKYKEINDKG